jgi:hypothetical protein
MKFSDPQFSIIAVEFIKIDYTIIRLTYHNVIQKELSFFIRDRPDINFVREQYQPQRVLCSLLQLLVFVHPDVLSYAI